jgi:hypothetical protein
MGWQRISWTIARILFGLFFIFAVVMIAVMFGGNHPPESTEAAQRFTGALNEAGWINPALSAVLLAGGVALLFDRFAPIGLILLATPIGLIAGFHFFTTHSYVWGAIWPLWWAVLAFHYRNVFARLWAPSSR